MGHERAASTRCNHCPQLFVGPAFIVGAPATARTVEYINTLRAHMAEKHPAEYAQCDIGATQFLTALVLSQFTTTDDELAKQTDFIRWQVHQKTLMARIPDDKMTAQVDNIAEDLIDIFTDSLRTVETDGRNLKAEKDCAIFVDELKAAINAKLMPAFKGVRDVLEEPGKYTVSRIEQPANSRILTPR